MDDALPPPIIDKQQMYALLYRGALGNTVPMFFDVGEWEASPAYSQYSTWGVRTLTAGGPCRLFCPREEVREVAGGYQAQGHRVNISLMIDAVCRVTLMADICDSWRGLVVHGVEHPAKGASWRRVMPTLGREYTGLAAVGLLNKHLNPSSRADLEVLRDLYPGHVVELSACDRCIGVIPGRSAIIWEVRKY
jgi:hypothetical protein